VLAKLATRVRGYSTGRGNKADDAVAIARAATHSKHRRFVQPDDANVALKLLSDRRHEMVASRTQSVCRLHHLIRELIPGGTRRDLIAERTSDPVAPVEVDDPANEMRVELALDHADDIRRFDLRLDELAKRINAAVTESKTTSPGSCSEVGVVFDGRQVRCGPGFETAVHVGDVLVAHVLERERGKCSACA